jgi:hypothetical protein
MKVKIDLQVVEPENKNFHLLAVSTFDDNSIGYWIIDTGASRTVFDKNLPNKYQYIDKESNQLHTAGIGEKPIETAIVCVSPFYIARLKIENMEAALLDLAHINQLYSNLVKLNICGLLGGDFLMKYNAVVDYKKKKLILNPGKYF